MIKSRNVKESHTLWKQRLNSRRVKKMSSEKFILHYNFQNSQKPTLHFFLPWLTSFQQNTIATIASYQWDKTEVICCFHNHSQKKVNKQNSFLTAYNVWRIASCLNFNELGFCLHYLHIILEHYFLIFHIKLKNKMYC